MQRNVIISASAVLLLSLVACGDDNPGTNSTTDAGADAGSDAESDAAVPSAQVGDPCYLDEDCPEGGLCWTNLDGFPGGYCVIEGCTAGDCPEGSVCESFTDNVMRCVPSCEAHTDCRTEHGYVCDTNHTCWPGDGTVSPGGPCGAGEHCQGGADAYCIIHPEFPGGYCVITDCTASSCPAGSHCAAIFQSGNSACVPDCTADEDCEAGYLCQLEPNHNWTDACFPLCTADEQCPSGRECRPSETFAGSWVCLDVSHECSTNNHTGDCPAGNVCNQGVCEPFTCSDTVLEPNDSRTAAQALPLADTAGLQICSGDHDWFSFTPDTPDVVYHVGIDSNYASGNLEVDLVDENDTTHDDARLVPTDYHEENPVGPTNLQLHSMIGAAGSDPWWLHVYGRSGAVNNYGLVVREIPWQDGPLCEALFSAESCRSKYAGGSHDPSQLIVFPNGNPLDAFIGDAVYFDNGLSAFGNPPITFTSARYGRRELIMAVRNAIHAVQLEFPGTAPLSIGEVSMPDGTTPYGHPNGTHYYGANVDIAYYIDPAYHTVAGNLAYRQICCDAPLNDWDCVDTNTGSSNYGNCVTGSESTHIVDLPRTALLVAKLVASGRIRVIGFEAKIQAGFNAAVDDLVTAGVISVGEGNGAKGNIATSNDDGSWIWHFNHMHVSFCSGDCVGAQTDGSTKVTQGPWPNLPLSLQSQLVREHYQQH